MINTAPKRRVYAPETEELREAFFASGLTAVQLANRLPRLKPYAVSLALIDGFVSLDRLNLIREYFKLPPVSEKRISLPPGNLTKARRAS